MPEDAESLLSLLRAIGETGLETLHEVDFIVSEEPGFAVVLADGGCRLLVGRDGFSSRAATLPRRGGQGAARGGGRPPLFQGQVGIEETS